PRLVTHSCGFAKPFRSLAVALRRSPTFLAKDAHAVLCIYAAALSQPAVPFHRLAVVLHHVDALLIGDGQNRLRGAVSVTRLSFDFLKLLWRQFGDLLQSVVGGEDRIRKEKQPRNTADKR